MKKGKQICKNKKYLPKKKRGKEQVKGARRGMRDGTKQKKKERGYRLLFFFFLPLFFFPKRQKLPDENKKKIWYVFAEFVLASFLYFFGCFFPVSFPLPPSPPSTTFTFHYFILSSQGRIKELIHIIRMKNFKEFENLVHLNFLR